MQALVMILLILYVVLMIVRGIYLDKKSERARKRWLS